jgi:hypothetical protein
MGHHLRVSWRDVVTIRPSATSTALRHGAFLLNLSRGSDEPLSTTCGLDSNQVKQDAPSMHRSMADGERMHPPSSRHPICSELMDEAAVDYIIVDGVPSSNEPNI